MFVNYPKLRRLTANVIAKIGWVGQERQDGIQFNWRFSVNSDDKIVRISSFFFEDIHILLRLYGKKTTDIKSL